jgi:hypothetical protein
MNGLMFVGHQEIGRIYVFDLQRGAGTGAFTVVGEYATQFSEIAELSFDRSTGLLYVLHDASFDTIEVLDLSSHPIAGQPSCTQVSALRKMNTVAEYALPVASNNGGFAIVSRTDCEGGVRKAFLAIDDGGSGSFFMFDQFTPGCESAVPAASTWGVIVLAHLLAVSGSIVLRMPRPASTK